MALAYHLLHSPPSSRRGCCRWSQVSTHLGEGSAGVGLETIVSAKLTEAPFNELTNLPKDKWRLDAANDEAKAEELRRESPLAYMVANLDPRWSLELLCEQKGLLERWQLEAFQAAVKAKWAHVTRVLRLPFWRSRFSGSMTIDKSESKAGKAAGMLDRFGDCAKSAPVRSPVFVWATLKQYASRLLKTKCNFMPGVLSRTLLSWRWGGGDANASSVEKLDKKQGSNMMLQMVGLSQDDLQSVATSANSQTATAIAELIAQHQCLAWLKPVLELLLLPSPKLRPTLTVTEGDLCELRRALLNEAGWRALVHGGGQYSALVRDLSIDDRSFPAVWPTPMVGDDDRIERLIFHMDTILAAAEAAGAGGDWKEHLRTTAHTWSRCLNEGGGGR